MARSDFRSARGPFGSKGANSPLPDPLQHQSQRDFELDLFARILDRDPLFIDVLRAHANNLAARGLHHRALQYDRQLIRLLPDRPVVWYNLACTYARLDMVDSAFTALQRAMDLGYRSLRHLRRDPDLNSLRCDVRFDRILRKALAREYRLRSLER